MGEGAEERKAWCEQRLGGRSEHVWGASESEGPEGLVGLRWAMSLDRLTGSRSGVWALEFRLHLVGSGEACQGFEQMSRTVQGVVGSQSVAGRFVS